jgi:aminoglycoside phosphotransferase family enzyme/predicted kinase
VSATKTAATSATAPTPASPALPDFITALQRAEAYDHPVETITLFETHISWVLLTGEFAYKIKKPVDFGFLDFSTLEKRRFYCEEELRLNGRLAPQLYLKVVPICGHPAAPFVDGSGPAFEYAVKMRQFDPRQTFDELLARGALTSALMEETATMLAGFHQQIAVASPEDGYGTARAIQQPVQENFTQLEQALAGVQQAADIRAACETLRHWSRKQQKKLRPIFDGRKQQGFIRECHGDLHLRNIVLWQHKVTPFDGIEFNPNLRWIDVMSELAFLLMDLDDHRQTTLARLLLNRYLVLTGDYAGLATLRFYQVYRAMVRAKVAGLRLGQLSAVKPDPACLAEIGNYIQLALTYTQPPAAGLVITHGLSGSGKTWLARQLVLSHDLIHLRSDVERKRLFGLTETAQSGSAIDAGIYSREATQATYERLALLAETCITSGFSVIVDATFRKRKQRDIFRALARRLQCDFHILDCTADAAQLRQRIQTRAQQGGDASEADLAVLEKQLRKQKPLHSEEQTFALQIDTTGEVDLAAIKQWLSHS